MAVWGVAHQSIVILEEGLPSRWFPTVHTHLPDRVEWPPCIEGLPRPVYR
jgi:hypothetical protein